MVREGTENWDNNLPPLSVVSSANRAGKSGCFEGIRFIDRPTGAARKKSGRLASQILRAGTEEQRDRQVYGL